jgi:M6 family metalloprotease-like protein
MKTNTWIVLLCSLVFAGGSAIAAPMHGEPITFIQPDGTTIHLQVFGDEFYAETRTSDGYTVVFDPASKAYYYAVLSSSGNEFDSSGVLVGTGRPPAGLPKKLTINKESKRAKSKQRRALHEQETGQKERWEAIKEQTRKKRETKNKQKKAAEPEGEAAASAAGEGEAEGGGTSGPLPAPPSSETTGDRVGLTILVEFPDEAGTIPQQEVDDYCNKPGYSGFSNDGSIYDYFYNQTEGKLRYHNVVTAYVMAPNVKSYYNDTSKSAGVCGRLLLNDVLQVLLDEGFDFSHCTTNASGRLHAINMFFTGANSGVWSKGLWPHKSGLSPDVSLGGGIYADQYQTSNMGTSLRIGTFIHETGHLLCGFPDFYDYDYDSAGVGNYSLMAYSGYSTHPVSVDGYLKYHAGWIETIGISSNSHERGSVRVDYGSLYQYLNPANADEYFMIDNRQKIGLENGAYLRDEGLLFMHCDEGGNHNYQEMSDTNHFEVSIEQADGLFQLEYDINSGGAGDLFHSGYVDEFTDSTLPNAHWWSNATTNPASGDPSGLYVHDISANGETMTFIVGAGALSGTAELGVDRSLLKPRAFNGASPSNMKIAVWNKQSGTLSYTVSSPTSWISVGPTSGSATTESDLITISFSTAALASGVHYGEVTVQNSSVPGDFHTITIELTIEALPLLGASPSSISITGAVGNVSDAVSVMVANAGGGELDYNISGPFWLSISSPTGSVSGDVDVRYVSFDSTGLSEGTYTGALTVTSADAGNSPINIPLSFTIQDLLLLAPGGGDYVNLDTIMIEWESSTSAYPYVDIELWRDGQQKAVIADDTPNDGSYEWTVPSYLSSASNYTIRVSAEGSATYKESGSLGVWVYQASFESDLDGWENRTDDDFDWTRNSGGTPSSETGPSGASHGSYYIYMEASSPNYPDMVAIISNRIDFSSYSELSMSFDYHMYGANCGRLHLDLYDGTAWHDNIWTITGQQNTAESDPWNTATVDLSPFAGNSAVDLVLWGITDWWDGDMCIDNIRMGSGAETILTNGVPASWMQSFGLVANDVTALLDSDGDGMPNWAEYFAGTSPTDPDSLLEITESQNDPAGLVVTWSAVYGKSYRLMKGTNLVLTNWSNEASGVPGVEPTCTHTVTTDSAVGFIKVQVEE